MTSIESLRLQQQPHPDPKAIAGKVNREKCYLLLSNPSKSTHLGTLLRCAAAFQVHQVLLVGYDKFNCQGSFGSHLFLDIVVFPSWDRVLEYLRRGGDDGVHDTGNNNASNCNANGGSGGGGTVSGSGDTIDQGEHTKSSTKEMPADEENENNNGSVISSSSAGNSIAMIGILGAYGGGEGLFSPDGMTVYEHVDENYVSLTPPKETANPDTLPCVSHRSFPIGSRQFSTNVNVCLLLSKDKQGLTLSEAQMCSGFVHVPHLSFDDVSSPTLPSSQRPEKNYSVLTKIAPTTTLGELPTNQNTILSISQSHLLDTATILSTVLHHFTAWANYKERTFVESQKFVKDIKPNARRRLCRVYGSNNGKKEQTEDSQKSGGSTNQEEIDVLLLWKENEDVSQEGDY